MLALAVTPSVHSSSVGNSLQSRFLSMRVRVCMRVHIDETSQYESSNEEGELLRYTIYQVLLAAMALCARAEAPTLSYNSFAPVRCASACDTACLRRHSMRRSTVKPQKKNGKEKEEKKESCVQRRCWRSR